MQRVRIAELKDQLSKYLRAVEAGTEVEVTDRDRPIARIVPVMPVAGVEIQPPGAAFSKLRSRRYPAATWPQSSTELLLEERQGR